MRKRAARGLFAQALLALALTLCAALDPLSSSFLRLSDALYRAPAAPSPDIYVIGIDESTLTELGPFQTWSRDKIAEMIELLSSDPDFAPAVIAVDVGFYGESGTEADERLAKAVEKAGNVVLASYANKGEALIGEGAQAHIETVITQVEKPFPALLEYCRAGLTNTLPDADGVSRRAIAYIEHEGEREYSFAAEIYRAFTGNETLPAWAEKGVFRPRYAGAPGDYYGPAGDGCSFISVLSGEYPYQLFAGSVVIIGAYASGMMDSYFTPMSAEKAMYGAEIHANFVQALLEGNFVSDAPGWIPVLFTLLVCLLTALLVYLLDIRLSGLCALALCALCALSGVWLYRAGIFLLPFYPAASALVMYVSGGVTKYIAERREKRRMFDIMSRYLSPQVAGKLARHGDDALRSEGEKRDIAVLFVDIRGFTTLSESMPPEEVVRFLNRYLTLTASSIFHNDGTVDKFIGDATMGLFNAPNDLDDYVMRAVRAGLDMAEGAKKLEKELTLSGGRRVGFGVGVHCGDAVVGSIGPSFRMDYTAIGDTVNTASRIEGQAGAGQVLVSQEVINRVGDRLLYEFAGERQLKGKSEGFKIYSVLGVKEGKAE